MRVLVAMSGGVDSSAVAGLLTKAGHEVIGVTLQLYDHGAATSRKGACCAGQDIHDARRVADTLGIAHYVIDAEARFRAAVMADFADSYAAGETPVPCVRCNQSVKFADLLALATDLGAERLATGHYVRRLDGPAGAQLHRAVDPARDQSWFLFATTRAQLERSLFPLGDMPDKATVRAEAARLGLSVAAKPDSQDICFVPQGSYADVVGRMRPDAVAPGDIVTADGTVVGRHDGIARYTVGQAKRLGTATQARRVGAASQAARAGPATQAGRPGLAVHAGRLGAGSDAGRLGAGSDAGRLGAATQAAEGRRVVIGLDSERRRVVVGPATGGTTVVLLREVNWLVAPRELRCAVKLRARDGLRVARVLPTDDGAEVHLDEAVLPAPGQACVFYDGDRVLGGGFIRPPPRRD